MVMSVNRKCKVCSKPFKPKRSDAVYCSATCRKKAQRMKRVCSGPNCENILKKTHKKYCSRVCQKADSAQRRVERFCQSGFGNYLLQEVIRAGTVEILQDLRDFSCLEEMFQLYKLRVHFNGYQERSEYHLCHLYPVKGKCGVGLISPRNIFIGMGIVNRSLGNYENSELGAFIRRDVLQDVWEVGKGKKGSDQIRSYLGDALDELCTKHNLGVKRSSSRKREVTNIEHPLTVLRSEGKRVKSDLRFSQSFRDHVQSVISSYPKKTSFTSNEWTIHRDTSLQLWFPWDKENFDYERDYKPFLEDGSTVQDRVELDLIDSFESIFKGGDLF